MSYKLKINTSYVSPLNIKKAIDNNYLPIFIIRDIINLPIIGKYNGTSIHMKILSPSEELLEKISNGLISEDDFEKKYIIEMSNVNFTEIINKLNYLCELSNASGIILFGYKDDPYRYILSDLLNNTRFLENEVTEIEF